MELFAETLSVVGALVLSVSCGLLLEELIFGGLVRLFFAPARFRQRDPSLKEVLRQRIQQRLAARDGSLKTERNGGGRMKPANEVDSAHH
ncbi:MAG TPA: hypothetical protein VMD92_06055 [Acidobacteriaceae bacterium]|nr:hypothetical protein [Acidobacteriaceae bacterium]